MCIEIVIGKSLQGNFGNPILLTRSGRDFHFLVRILPKPKWAPLENHKPAESLTQMPLEGL